MRHENITTLATSSSEGNEGKRNKKAQILSALLSASALGVFLEGCGGDEAAVRGSTPPIPISGPLGSEFNPYRGTAEADSFKGNQFNVPSLDWVSYADTEANAEDTTDTSGVTITLLEDVDNLAKFAATTSGSWAEGDSLIGFNNVYGSDQDDELTGNSNDNTFRGNLGADTLTGGAGNDILDGGRGDDIDTLRGGKGDDFLQGHEGADILNGGEGDEVIGDWVSYSNSELGVRVSLVATGGLQVDFDEPDPDTPNPLTDGFSPNENEAVGDLISDIENIAGSDKNDWLTGDEFANILHGDDGADIIEGGEGADTASYVGSDAAVNIALDADGSASRIEGGHAEGDTLTSIENLVGSAHADTLTGNELTNILEGGDGGDTIDGGEGEGEDIASYRISDAGVRIALADDGGLTRGSGGHAEGDRLTNIQHLTGSAHADTLTGNNLKNTLNGGAGGDTLNGGAGVDTLNGDAGADTLNGDEGEDILNGGEGGDTLNGGADNDVLNGDAGNDILNGDDGEDTLNGGDGNDTLYGGADVDTLYGNAGDDTLEGDAGQDILNGDGGNDTLYGGADVDTLNGNAGNDTLEGGEGGDILDGGSGEDWASYSRSDKGVRVDLTISGGQQDFDEENGFIANQNEAVDDTISNIANIQGSAQKDWLTGDENANTLRGDGGDDLLYGGDGADILNGDEGVDTLNGGDGDDTLNGGADDDTLNGEAGADELNGDEGGDTLNGGAGDDTLSGGIGADIINGGDDEDEVSYSSSLFGVRVSLLLQGEGSPVQIDFNNDFQSKFGVTAGITAGFTKAATNNEAVGDILNGIENIVGSDKDDWLAGDENANKLEGGGATDTAIYADSGAGVTITLAEAGFLSEKGIGGHAADDRLQDIEDLIGSNYDDTLTGNSGINKFYGGDGVDTLIGGAGADTLNGDAGDDKIYGGDDRDVLYGGAGDDTIDGGAGRDEIVGGDGDDKLNGGEGNDFFVGGRGADTINGDEGDDFLLGQSGADTYLFDAGGGTDTILLLGVSDGVGNKLVFRVETDGTEYQAGDFTFERGTVTTIPSADGTRVSAASFEAGEEATDLGLRITVDRDTTEGVDNIVYIRYYFTTSNTDADYTIYRNSEAEGNIVEGLAETLLTAT